MVRFLREEQGWAGSLSGCSIIVIVLGNSSHLEASQNTSSVCGCLRVHTLLWSAQLPLGASQYEGHFSGVR